MAKKDKDVTTSGAENNQFAVTTAAPVDLSKLKLKKHVVIPTISIDKMKQDEILMFKAMSAIRYTTTTNEDGTIKMDEKNPEQPAQLPLLTITRLDTGEFGQIVLPCMVHNALFEEQQVAPLEGRLFTMKKGEAKALKGGKRMNVWQVLELSE